MADSERNPQTTPEAVTVFGFSCFHLGISGTFLITLHFYENMATPFPLVIPGIADFHVNFNKNGIMFQHLATNNAVDYNGENELIQTEDVNVQRMATAMFCQKTIEDLATNFESMDKLPISCSKLQIITKELKFKENEKDLGATNIKPHSTPATLLWLGKNYELAEGICIPRNTLYSHYIHFCKSNAMSPLNSASFGKSSAINLPKNKESLKVWPEFPNMKEISFPPHVSQEKVTSFIIMYHTHCQRIFDTIVRGTLDDAYQFLEHFWQGVPSHLSELLNTNTVVNMVGVCDSILYRTISSVIMPSVLKRCSENLIHMIRNFADKLENWINLALADVPTNLKSLKLKLGKRFCTTLRRQMVLYQLTHTAQVVLNNCEMMNHINKDWKRINLGPIMKQVLQFTEYSHDHIETIKYINSYWKNFQELIERQAAIEDFTEKVENLVHICIVEVSKKKQVPLRNVARTFILLWHVMESLISRDMTIHSAASFGSFHLIQTLFDEYVHYLVDMLHSEDITKYLLKNVTLDVLPNLDSNWNEFNDSNCFDIFNATSNLRSLDNITGGSLDVIQGDFQSNNFLYSGGSDFNFSKTNSPQIDCNFISNECAYQDDREGGLEAKFNHCDTFSENIPLSDFNGCDPECVEFSAGIYCQETLHYNTQNLQYQSGSYNEGDDFECLE